MTTTDGAPAASSAPITVPDMASDLNVTDPHSAGTTGSVAPLDPFPYQYIVEAISRPSDFLP
ncbi:MAG: hypothetical protein ACC726_14940, partial [Chloroflexota bacterium]